MARQDRTRHWQGETRQSKPLARQGGTRKGRTGQGIVKAGRGKAGSSRARQGVARPGQVRQGMAVQTWHAKCYHHHLTERWEVISPTCGPPITFGGTPHIWGPPTLSWPQHPTDDHPPTVSYPQHRLGTPTPHSPTVSYSRHTIWHNIKVVKVFKHVHT